MAALTLRNTSGDVATKTATGSNGLFTITVSPDNLGISVGQKVTGTGINALATVSTISGTTITLSAANTSAVSGTVTFAEVNNAAPLTNSQVDENFKELRKDIAAAIGNERSNPATLTNKTLGTGTTITAGTINGASVGATTPSTGAFTTISGDGASVTNLNAGNIATGTLGVARGGTGASTLTSGNVLIGAGTSPVTGVAPGTNGNILTVVGGVWTSAAPTVGGVTSVDITTGTTGLTATGGPIVNSGSIAIGGTLNISNGGTGATSRQTAINALAGATTSGQYLRGNGTNITMSAIQAADVPTLNQNTTGTASNVTGTVLVSNGGTGATTLTGVLKGNGTSAFTAATAGTDYAKPDTASTWTTNQAYQANITFNGGTRSIGTSDANIFNILTNNTNRISITSAGVMTFTGTQLSNITTPTLLDLDLSTANYFKKSVTSNPSITASNLPASGVAYSFTLELAMSSGASSVTWSTGLTGVTWSGGTAPTLTANKTHLFMFVTSDGGTTWRASSLINY